MTRIDSYRAMFKRAKASPGFWTEAAVLQFVRGLRRIMQSEPKFSQKELADAMKVSEAYVSDVLRGRRQNFSLAQMNKLAGHLDAKVDVHVSRRDVVVLWTEKRPEDVAGEAIETVRDSTSDPAFQEPMRLAEALTAAETLKPLNFDKFVSRRVASC